MSNPLFDTEFLMKLLSQQQRTVYARVIALTNDELPIEYIEGQITNSGSINIDGNSAVRRTCSLTLVAKDLSIRDYYWGLKTKFKLEIGLKNTINPSYDDIIWFKQGIYVITSFSTAQGTNNYTVNISGKDKMCLLNGDLGGALPHTTDFGVEEYYDSTTNTTTYTSIPIRTILREAVQNFGFELPSNIIINDIEDAGLELLEYRGDIPLYLLREITSDTFTNMVINSKQPCYYQDEEDWVKTTISQIPQYDSLVELEGAREPSVICLSLGGTEYNVAKVEYGNIPGYRLTDLTYAGDLILNVGETVTSLLDKIKNMLGNYEYFYNLDGKFVFQKKRTYVSIPWLNGETDEELPYENTTTMWNFLGDKTITTFNNSPNLSNLRNDFAVWGKKKMTSGGELDIHMRYAIDEKPQKYHSLIDDKDYTTDEYDWRELIYRMALDYRKYYHDDDFLYNIAQANSRWEDGPLYITGRTGYEQYYIDMEGFWRLLYDPTRGEAQYQEADPEEMELEEVYIQQPYRKVEKTDEGSITYKDAYVFNEEGNFIPFEESCFLREGYYYYYRKTNGEFSSPIEYTSEESNNLNSFSIKDLYVANTMEFHTIDGKQFLDSKDKTFLVLAMSEDGEYTSVLDYEFVLALNEGKITFYMRDNDSSVFLPYNDLPKKIQALYRPSSWTESILGQTVGYYEQYYNYAENGWNIEVSNNPENLLFWLDFLDANGSEIGKYSVKNVGVRSKATTDNDVKTIYYREIPKVIFKSSSEKDYEHQTGYTYVQLQNNMENLFTISSKGVSAKERIEEWLETYGYCTESVTINSLPIYHLEPNSRIWVEDEESGVSGEYLVSKITIPLTYNGTMSITATKVVTDIT